MKLSEITTGTLNELRYSYSSTGEELDIFSEGNQEVYDAISEDADSELLDSEEMWVGKFSFGGYDYAIMGDGSLTSNGQYILGRIIEDERVDKYLEDTQAICESEESDKVLEFKKLKEFSLEFQRLYVNGEVWGVFYDENDNLVCQTQGGEIIEDILRD